MSFYVAVQVDSIIKSYDVIDCYAIYDFKYEPIIYDILSSSGSQAYVMDDIIYDGCISLCSQL